MLTDLSLYCEDWKDDSISLIGFGEIEWILAHTIQVFLIEWELDPQSFEYIFFF